MHRHVKVRTLLFIAITLLSISCTAIASVPAATRDRLNHLRRWTEERDEAVLRQEFLVQFKDELERINASKLRLSAPTLLQQFRDAHRQADQITSQAAKQPGQTIPLTVFRLPCAAYEALRGRVGLAHIGAADRLLYANSLARLDAIPVDPLVTASAFAEVREARPNADEEQSALVGEIQALILAEQQDPGTHFPTIQQLVDTLRKRHSKGNSFYKALLLTGEALQWHRKPDEARPLYQEAIERFGERAVVAKNRLQRMNATSR